MTDQVKSPRRWLRTPIQRGSLVLWLGATLSIAIAALLPTPFVIRDDFRLEEAPGQRAEKKGRTAIPRSCLLGLPGISTDRLDRDIMIVDYFATDYSLIIAESVDKLFAAPHGDKYFFYPSELEKARAGLIAGPLCITSGGKRHCTSTLNSSNFKDILAICAKDSPVYLNRVGTYVSWQMWDNLSNANRNLMNGLLLTWLISALVFLFAAPAVRLWRWIRFG